MTNPRTIFAPAGSTMNLVSCIMPTANRRRYVPLAINYFLRADYPAKELIVVDDGEDSVEDLVPADPRIRYIRESKRRSVGAKRNLACEEARGEIIVHWDDDDWSAPWRLSYQAEQLVQHGSDICGLNRVYFWDPVQGSAWEYLHSGGQRWVYGASFCYQKSFWKRNPFPDCNVGEDSRFIWQSRTARIRALDDPRFLVAVVHRQNTSPKVVRQRQYHPVSEHKVTALLGDDLIAYRSSQARPVATSPRRLERVSPNLAAPSLDERKDLPMLTSARASDLQLSEFAALNHGVSLPHMRRWELPFALFQARLESTSRVLDCTVNPAGLSERMARLYPHALYRHWAPIQHGKFVLPLGVPDSSFDRVLCINTLEHLLEDQRRQLIAAMATKLRPGGRLVLTSDYYFDSSWSDPAFLNLGVMRADRQETFNGWNKVGFDHWIQLAAAHGLHPDQPPGEEPVESDATLYRNVRPHAHACIGGVFSRPGPAPVPPGRKIVLALLTWNTRQVSIDSVRAYLREGKMLRRLGQEPFLCVCDNGSTDGTASALRDLEPEIDLPCKFILNERNLGNSIARNQIIDHAREIGADYVLFMDGDIEVVPFSSFAMFRHMENSGRQLGCIGADSAACSPQRGRTSPSWYSVDRIEPGNLVAWTQYGMFRREVFDAGVRFDESGPFNGAGWGYEDNDLAFQMEMRGLVNQRFFGMTYLHRDARSSVRIMRAQGIDASALCAKRRQYVIDKWASVQPIDLGPLATIRRHAVSV